MSSEAGGQDSDPSLDLEDELDRLYGVAFDQFVSARTGLVRALRKERRRAEAATVEELKKPSRVVWTVNQLVRRNRKDIDLLLDVGHRLLAGQKAVLGGAGPASFDEARETNGRSSNGFERKPRRSWAITRRPRPSIT